MTQFGHTSMNLHSTPLSFSPGLYTADPNQVHKIRVSFFQDLPSNHKALLYCRHGPGLQQLRLSRLNKGQGHQGI